jgi:hypothetical protein
MTPALLKRTWSFVSADRKAWAEALIVVRSLRSSRRKTRLPFDSGAARFMSLIAVFALSSERATT